MPDSADDPNGSTRFNDEARSVEVLIIGFGLSAIPLIRELERDGIDYVVISSGESIWDRLDAHDRLDFDMVSSMHTSLYSFELVKRDATDRYLTSKDFSRFIREYLDLYSSRVVDDFVMTVENSVSRSLVRTRGGRIFEANHLVIATAFRRRMNHLLNEFDYESARNKTIAITGMGDSVNLIISKLIPYNNRIVLITNGFFLLDKLTFYDGVSYTLDQLEYHNVRRLSYLLYRKTITTGLEFVILCQKLFKFASLNHVYFKHPLATRWFTPAIGIRNFPQSPFPNGIVAIKYWPIESYQKLFDNDTLKATISSGYLLNDITFFLEQRLVELWPKKDTLIDREARSIRWNDKQIGYDYIVEPDYEAPNLPDIFANKENDGQYKYIYRNTFMGIVPKELNNVYLIGYTRPTTGGLSGIIEMQGLFAHKMISDAGFRTEIYENLDSRIKKYNNYYNILNTTGRSDHLVNYGFYIDDLARLMKIAPRLSDCRSIRDVLIHYLFPNTAFKYRQEGPYKVEGAKEMVQSIYENHKRFSVLLNYLMTYALLQLTGYVGVIVAYFRQELPAAAAIALLVLVLVNPVTPFVAANGVPRNSYLNLLMIAALGLTSYFQTPVIPILSLLITFALTYALHRHGWTKAPFNDLKGKGRSSYLDFFKRYCEAMKESFSERASSARRASVTSKSALDVSDHAKRL